jgi:hypothetical protein
VRKDLRWLLRESHTHLKKLVPVAIDELRASRLIFEFQNQLSLVTLNRKYVCFGGKISIESRYANAF